MQHLVPVTLRRLRIAAARLRTEPRRSGLDRAIWIAARNHRRDRLADPDASTDTITLPAHLVDRIRELAGEPQALASGVSQLAPTDTTIPLKEISDDDTQSTPDGLA